MAGTLQNLLALANFDFLSIIYKGPTYTVCASHIYNIEYMTRKHNAHEYHMLCLCVPGKLV